MNYANFTGREVIRTSVRYITPDNIIEVLSRALMVHQKNRSQIDYLYKVYCGRQDVLYREKEVRPEINNTVVVNRANEIVTFKNSYCFGEPVQYVSRTDDQETTDKITKLNEYCLAENKPSKDLDMMEWSHICGTAYRMILPDRTVDEDESPFEMYTLDPRNSFVVYYNDGLGNPAVMGVKYVQQDDGNTIYSCYTEDAYYEIENGVNLVYWSYQILGIPIVEYPLNNARLGAFEIVLSLLDAINTVASNRVDGVEQFVQALMLFHNVDISTEDFKALREEGALKYKDIDQQMKAEVKYLVEEMNQQGTQTLVDDMYETVLTIVGMPNRNGGSSTSDTGSAVTMRDGWSAAEARAKHTEMMYKRSDEFTLKLILRLCDNLRGLNLKMSSIETRFTRRNYENIGAKATVLTQMLSNSKIHPLLAFIHSGMFSDPNVAYRMSVKYAEEQAEKQKEVFGDGNQPPAGGGDGDQPGPVEGENG